MSNYATENVLELEFSVVNNCDQMLIERCYGPSPLVKMYSGKTIKFADGDVMVIPEGAKFAVMAPTGAQLKFSGPGRVKVSRGEQPFAEGKVVSLATLIAGEIWLLISPWNTGQYDVVTPDATTGGEG